MMTKAIERLSIQRKVSSKFDKERASMAYFPIKQPKPTKYLGRTPRVTLILKDTVISAPPELYSCAQNQPSVASETPGRAHLGASGPFPPATHTLGTLWPAGLAGGDLWWSPAAVPQAKDAISVWLSSGLREPCG